MATRAAELLDALLVRVEWLGFHSYFAVVQHVLQIFMSWMYFCGLLQCFMRFDGSVRPVLPQKIRSVVRSRYYEVTEVAVIGSWLKLLCSSVSCCGIVGVFLCGVCMGEIDRQTDRQEERQTDR